MVEEHAPKVLLILERSEDNSLPVGLVKDCHGSTPVDMGTCDVVGTWSRLGEGTFYVELITPIDALQDTLIQLISERVRSNETSTYPIIHRTDTSRKPSPRPEPTPDVPSAEFGSLRAKLGR